MALEQEVPSLLVNGFIIIIAITCLVTLAAWYRTKSKHIGYFFTLLHLGVFSIAVYFLIQATRIEPNHPMSSELVSLEIGQAGIFWALSMGCLMVAIVGFSKN
ncbi:hypothetical protein ACTWQB_13365 [Piscibacillus sp. B03]|uniref:hypothetical protein n=1 Tax=Piscibacillus sp. B03 TaxID=3457430 RepID=UPI003FCC4535